MAYRGSGQRDSLNIGSLLDYLSETGLLPKKRIDLAEVIGIPKEKVSDLIGHRSNLTERCFFDVSDKENKDIVTDLDDLKRNFSEELASVLTGNLECESEEKAAELAQKLNGWINGENDIELTTERTAFLTEKTGRQAKEEKLAELIFYICGRCNDARSQKRKNANTEAETKKEKTDSVPAAEKVLSLFASIEDVQSAVKKVLANPLFIRKKHSDILKELKSADKVVSALGLPDGEVFTMLSEFAQAAENVQKQTEEEEKRILSFISLFPKCSVCVSTASELFDTNRLFDMQQKGLIRFTDDLKNLNGDFAYRLVFECASLFDTAYEKHRQETRRYMGFVLAGKAQCSEAACVLSRIDFSEYGNEETTLLISLLRYWAEKERDTLHRAENIWTRLNEIAEIQIKNSRAENERKIAEGIKGFVKEVQRLAEEN